MICTKTTHNRKHLCSLVLKLQCSILFWNLQYAFIVQAHKFDSKRLKWFLVIWLLKFYYLTKGVQLLQSQLANCVVKRVNVTLRKCRTLGLCTCLPLRLFVWLRELQPAWQGEKYITPFAPHTGLNNSSIQWQPMLQLAVRLPRPEKLRGRENHFSFEFHLNQSITHCQSISLFLLWVLI